jgi:dihydrofolate reductase
MARNRVIGREGRLPWHLPGELRHFKETTMGRPIVMGRRTWESLGRPLPGRQNIVVTRNGAYSADGAEVAASLSEAVTIASGPEVMIIGGGQLYAEAMTHADRMILTRVECEPEGDTWFPEWDREEWHQVAIRHEPADAGNPLAYSVIELTRRPAADETCRAPGTPADPPA